METQQDPLADIGPSMPESAPMAQQDDVGTQFDGNPSTMQKLASSPVGRAFNSAADIGDTVVHPIDAVSPYVKSGFNSLTGNSFSGDQQQVNSTPSKSTSSPTMVPLPGAVQNQQPVIQKKPITPDHPGVQAVSKAAQGMMDANGQIDFEQLKYLTSKIDADDAQKSIALQNINMMQKHIQDSQALGRKAAYDTSGKKYWDDAGTGEKIGRVLLGVLTLGGSESFIGQQIKKQVAADQVNLNTEENTYKQMLDLGKTKEQALSIDASKQGHLFQLGLQKIISKYPQITPDMRSRIAAMQVGIDKETNLAMMSHFKQQQENQLGWYNAQTSRMSEENSKENSKKSLAQQVIRDSNGDVIGVADNPEQKKELQSQMSAYKSIQKLSKRVDDYDWGDKFGAESRAKARGLHAEILNQIDVFRSAKPTQENSRVADLLERMIPDPDEYSTTPGAFKAGYRQVLTMLGGQLTTNQLQSGIK